MTSKVLHNTIFKSKMAAMYLALYQNLTLFGLEGGGGGGGGGGSGGRKCPRRFQLSRTSLIFKQYLPNVATFTGICWRTRFWKKFASKVSHIAMATAYSTPCLLKF